MAIDPGSALRAPLSTASGAPPGTWSIAAIPGQVQAALGYRPFTANAKKPSVNQPAQAADTLRTCRRLQVAVTQGQVRTRPYRSAPKGRSPSRTGAART